MANIDDLYNKSFGQLGSVFTSGSSGVITPPSNKVFVAILILDQNTTFDTHGGLVADTNKGDMQYVTTEGSAGADIYSGGANGGSHSIAVGSETLESGGGGQELTNAQTFPLGTTIVGRYKRIAINSGAVIAYIGD